MDRIGVPYVPEGTALAVKRSPLSKHHIPYAQHSSGNYARPDSHVVADVYVIFIT